LEVIDRWKSERKGQRTNDRKGSPSGDGRCSLSCETETAAAEAVRGDLRPNSPVGIAIAVVIACLQQRQPNERRIVSSLIPRLCYSFTRAHQVLPSSTIHLDLQRLIHAAEQIIGQVWEDRAEQLEVGFDGLRWQPTGEVEAGGQRIFFCVAEYGQLWFTARSCGEKTDATW